MKKLLIFGILLLFVTTNIFAQNYIPFQYQNKSKWNWQEKWGLMTPDKKVVLPPTYYTIAPNVITEPYIFLGKSIVEIKTGKAVWDSIECKNVQDIRGNIVRIRMPLRGAYSYQPYSFKNVLTKKQIAEEGKWSDVKGFVINKNDLNEEGVVDENGKEIIKKVRYQDIMMKPTGCFVVINDYNTTKDIFDIKGVKLNKANYVKIDLSYETTPRIYATNLIDKEKNISELIFINAAGKEAIQHLFYKGKIDYLDIKEGIIKLKDSTVLFTNKNCDEASKLHNIFVINQEGKIIVNDKNINDIRFQHRMNVFVSYNKDTKTSMCYDSTGAVLFKSNIYRNIEMYGSNLFYANDITDAKKYLINSKGEKLMSEGIYSDKDMVNSLGNKGFLIYKNSNKVLSFNIYNAKTGKSTLGEQVLLGDSIKVEDISMVSTNYYFIKLSDNIRKQYVMYVYDVSGKLVDKSENAFWMISKDGTHIKYTENDKRDKFYFGYYDENLKPYSIIKE